jgi:hypothetical protein
VLVYHRDPRPNRDESGDDDHDANLAEQLEDDVLSAIASDLIEGIEEDNRSRAEWLSNRSKAVTLLGLMTENPRTDASSGAAVEGMSTVRHPLLLEASVRFQANALGELLPADGPVKVKDDGASDADRDAAAVALEKASNTFLTDTATEYYPDTDRMLFQTGCFGAGVKKGYHCPVRRRPVIEAVDAKDIIVNNSATDFDNAQRITHIIDMPPSTMKLMQLAGAYLDIDLSTPQDEPTELDRKLMTTQGIQRNGSRPQDTNHTVYECHCTYDISGFEHEEDGVETGLPLPYKIVIERTSRRILEIRRDWREGEDATQKRRTFVMYSFVPMFGLWPYGLYHLLGNTTQAITAAWRLILDNGMFNNFATFLYAKGATNNETPNFRAGPGQGIPIDCPQGKLSDSVMPVPYKQTDPSFMAFVDNLAQTGQRLGGTAEAQVGEGNQQAPVGTTLAMIDQAQKIMAGVHKRCHRAQRLELSMLRDLLREDPEALWRHRPDKKAPDNAQQIIDALNNYDFTPVSDPNTPTHMHRLMKTMGLVQRADTHPDRYDAATVELQALRAMGWDNPEQFMAKPPAPGSQPAPPPDPNAIRAAVALQTSKLRSDATLQAALLKAKQADADRQVKMMDIERRSSDAAQKLAASRQNKVLDITHSLAVHPQSLGVITQGNPNNSNQP